MKLGIQLLMLSVGFMIGATIADTWANKDSVILKIWRTEDGYKVKYNNKASYRFINEHPLYNPIDKIYEYFKDR